MFGIFKYTEKKLVKDIQDILTENAPGLKLDYDPTNSSVSILGEERFDGSPMVINLANLFIKMRNLSSSERRARLEINLQEFLSDHDISADDFIASLALRVRTTQELAIRDLYMQIQSGDPLKTLMLDANELHLELVSDQQESLKTVDQEALDKAGITKNEAFKIAQTTLFRSTDFQQWLEVDKGIWRSSYGDDYDFARIVSAADSLRLPFESDAIFYAPSHSVALVTNSQDPEVLRKMVEFGDSASQDHRPLSKNLWYCDSKSVWCKWAPESNAEIAQLQSYKELIENYDEQKKLLERWLEKTGEDSFIASYQVYEMDGRYRSICVYTLNVPSYLPKAEWVTVFDADAGEEGNIVGELDWKTFVEAVGVENLVEISAGRLERFKLMSVMTSEQDKALRNNAETE